MLRNVDNVDDLNKKKVPPTLSMFSIELTISLDAECCEAAKGA